MFLAWGFLIFVGFTAALTARSLQGLVTRGQGFETYSPIALAYKLGGVPGTVALLGIALAFCVRHVLHASREREAFEREVGLDEYWALRFEAQSNWPRWMHTWREDRTLSPTVIVIFGLLGLMLCGAVIAAFLFPDARLR